MNSVTTGVSVEILEDLNPLRELTADALEEIAKEFEVVEYPERSIVFRQGNQDSWTMYVLSGVLVLAEGPGKTRSLVGMGDAGAADEPLGFGQPYNESGVAKTDLKLLRIDTARLQQALEESRPPEIAVVEVEEMAEEEAGTQIFYKLFNDLMEDRLSLPSMPDVAVRVREAVADPKAGAPEVAKIVQSDPVVATRILAAANSAMYTGQRQVDSVSAAVVRLGLTTTRELVMAVTMREVFKSSSPLLNKRMVETWIHSSMVAAIASVLAKKVRGFMPDRALLAGLIHDIGVVPMLVHAENYPELINDPDKLESTINEYRGQIGSMILRKWNFPEDMVSVPTDSEDWHRNPPGKADLSDLIIVSQLTSFASGKNKDKYPRLPEIAAYQKLDIGGVTEDTEVPIVIAEARDEIAEVQKMLMGQ